jgi:hypothetical protein
LKHAKVIGRYLRGDRINFQPHKVPRQKSEQIILPKKTSGIRKADNYIIRGFRFI